MTTMTDSEALTVLDVEIQAFKNTEAMVSVGITERREAYAEHLAKLIAAHAHIAEALRDREWRPIESAPKDRPVLLAAFHITDEQGGPSVWSGRWDDFMEYFRTCNDYCPIWDATHWQPLPEPPK